jgi:hypothetical protein
MPPNSKNANTGYLIGSAMFFWLIPTESCKKSACTANISAKQAHYSAIPIRPALVGLVG